MALELTALIDEFALNQQWADKACATVNTSLRKIKVKTDYNIAVSIGDRNYIIASDASGVASVAIVPIATATDNALAVAFSKSQARLSVDADCLDKFGDAVAVAHLVATRKLRFGGDTSQLSDLESDLAGHMGMLRDGVEAAGPGADVIDMAIDRHNQDLEVQKDNGVATFVTTALALAGEYTVADQPLIMNFTKWLHYAASSNTGGNPGQSNYCTANMCLDAITFNKRTSCGITNFVPQTIMWGAVGGIGMRWKAFASQDMLGEAGDGSMLMNVKEAQQGVGTFMAVSFEWCCIMLMFKPDPNMSDHDARQMSLGYPNYRRPGAWGKLKGGGLTMDDVSAVTFHNMPLKTESEQKVTAGALELFPGKRIRVHGLVSSPEMNDCKGTLVEEVKAGVWHVTFDDQSSKLLKVKHMMPVHSTALKTESKDAKVEDAVAQPSPMSISGNWNDWIPQNMEWDAKQECFTLSTVLTETGVFGVCRGVAGPKPWKSGSFEKQRMNNTNGRYTIKVCLKDNKLGDITWEAQA